MHSLKKTPDNTVYLNEVGEVIDVTEHNGNRFEIFRLHRLAAGILKKGMKEIEHRSIVGWDGLN